jgi:hypothetical protein
MGKCRNGIRWSWEQRGHFGHTSLLGGVSPTMPQRLGESPGEERGIEESNGEVPRENNNGYSRERLDMERAGQAFQVQMPGKYAEGGCNGGRQMLVASSDESGGLIRARRSQRTGSHETIKYIQRVSPLRKGKQALTLDAHHQTSWHISSVSRMSLCPFCSAQRKLGVLSSVKRGNSRDKKDSSGPSFIAAHPAPLADRGISGSRRSSIGQLRARIIG